MENKLRRFKIKELGEHDEYTVMGFAAAQI